MIDTKQAHIDNGYYIKLTSTKEKNICVVTMPENLVLNLPELTTIYEMEDGKISVYRNKQKFLTKKCPNYARRIAIWGHICRLTEDRGLVSIPIVFEHIDKETSEKLTEVFEDFGNMKPLACALEEPSLHTDTELEMRLHDIISDIAHNRTNTIPDDILEGYTVSMNIFRGE